MRYLLLIYSKTPGAGEAPQRNYAPHWDLMEEAGRQGVYVAAEPLAPASIATTVRMSGAKALITDGPFAETKEQLAGYYVLDCANLDVAIEWAAKIAGACRNAQGVEIRPMPGLPR
jgi:hypothetical protein